MPGARDGPTASVRTAVAQHLDDAVDASRRPGAAPSAGRRCSRRWSTRRRPSRARRRAPGRRRRRGRRGRAAAVVGLTWPKRLAEGAAMPPPNAPSSPRASGWAGTRTPTVARPPVTTSSTPGRRCEQEGQRARASSASARARAAGRDGRPPSRQLRRPPRGGRSAGGRPAGPSPRRSGARRPRWRRRRPGRRRSRWGRPPARRRAGPRPPRSTSRSSCPSAGAVRPVRRRGTRAWRR